MIVPMLIGLGALFGPKIVQELAQPGRPPSREDVKRLLGEMRRRQALFTRLDPEGARHFDRDLCRALPTLLAFYSAALDAPSPRAPGARVWRLVARRPGLPIASAVLQQARVDGQDVYGSLPLVLACRMAADVPMLLVTAPPGRAPRLASPSGELALVDRVEAPAAPAPRAEPAPEPRPAAAQAESKLNGTGAPSQNGAVMGPNSPAPAAPAETKA